MRFVVNPAHRGILVVTEIRRPDPEACLSLTAGDTVDLTDDEVIKLVDLYGKTFVDGLLTPVAELQPGDQVEAEDGTKLDVVEKIGDDEYLVKEEGQAPSAEKSAEGSSDEGEQVAAGTKRGKGSRKK